MSKSVRTINRQMSLQRQYWLGKKRVRGTTLYFHSNMKGLNNNDDNNKMLVDVRHAVRIRVWTENESKEKREEACFASNDKDGPKGTIKLRTKKGLLPKFDS